MQDDAPEHWRLISVLYSSFPLTPEVASRLLHSAFDLYRFDQDLAEIGGGKLILAGQMRNLKQDASLGMFAGPTFEAHLETERGAGIVHFIVTRQGIELMAANASSTLN